MFLELSFDLGPLGGDAAEDAAHGCGACAVTFVDAHDDPVLEPAPGELRLWPATRVRCLFTEVADVGSLTRTLGAALGIDPALIEVQALPDRVWEREWLKDFHAVRFGRRLWVCPHHERVDEPGAVVVKLDPGLAFGTGSHASTALCLEWLDTHFPDSLAPAEHSEDRRAHGLDAHFPDSPAPAEHSSASSARVIDFGCGSGVLGLAAAKLGAAEVHAFDIDPQALIATRDNARANGVSSQVRVHDGAVTLPRATDVLLANILSGPLCALAADFAALLRPGGQVVLSGLMQHEAAEVTGAYAACFDVARCGDRDDWVCLVGRRR